MAQKNVFAHSRNIDNKIKKPIVTLLKASANAPQAAPKTCQNKITKAMSATNPNFENKEEEIKVNTIIPQVGNPFAHKAISLNIAWIPWKTM
jgi:hypothetical protein